MSQLEITSRDRDAIEIYRLQCHIAAEKFDKLAKWAGFNRVGAMVMLVCAILNIYFLNPVGYVVMSLVASYLMPSSLYMMYSSRKLKKKMEKCRLQISPEVREHLGIPEFK